MIHDLCLDGFRVRASLDFVEFDSLVHASWLKPHITGAIKCPAKPDQTGHYGLTIHDPTRADLVFLRDDLQDPTLRKVELSIDFFDFATSGAERERRLQACFLALGARLRVDDRHPTGAGYKACEDAYGNQVPPNVRLPRVNELLRVGHKDTGANFRLYLKKTDQTAPLPEEQWRVRMEITVYRSGLGLFGITKAGSLLGFKYRSAFARHFQVVDRVTVRDRADWSEDRRIKAERALARRWPAVGVHAIAAARMPRDALPATLAAAAFRQRPSRHAELPAAHYRFRPHKRAHAMIANALQQLERRLQRDEK